MPEEVNELCAIDYGALKQGFTWFLIVAGWVVVHILSSQREKNKDKRALIESIRSSVITIESSAIKYHTSKLESLEQVEEEILGLLDMIASRVNHIASEFAESEILALRKSITLGNFQTDKKSRTLYQLGSPFVLNIRDEAEKLRTKLDEKFYSLY